MQSHMRIRTASLKYLSHCVVQTSQECRAKNELEQKLKEHLYLENEHECK